MCFLLARSLYAFAVAVATFVPFVALAVSHALILPFRFAPFHRVLRVCVGVLRLYYHTGPDPAFNRCRG